MLDALLKIGTLIGGLVASAKQRASKRPSPTIYKDKHAWAWYKDGNRVPTFCVYCKQLETVASKWCPGVPSKELDE